MVTTSAATTTSTATAVTQSEASWRMEPEHNSPFNSFFLELEAGEWDQKRVLDRASIKNGPAALSRLIQKIEKNIDIYSKKKPKLTMARKKRDLYHLKNTMLIDDLRTEKSGLELMRCDGVSSVINYHNNRCRLLDSESKLIQPLEMYLNTNLEKYSLRLTGYPRTLLGEFFVIINVCVVHAIC